MFGGKCTRNKRSILYSNRKRDYLKELTITNTIATFDYTIQFIYHAILSTKNISKYLLSKESNKFFCHIKIVKWQMYTKINFLYNKDNN